ncbi:phage tail length tape measure family protein [Methylorubrum rhodesianum]|uniref:phage tail length tape measure family protein n=1 Tax=Methylorubrum rhodesianum TaxID=29427 RepID=UPI00374A35BE
MTNLVYQGGDIAAQLGSGSPLSMIALQQGPQIAQVFAGPGGASIRGAFSQAGEAAAGLAARVGILGGAVGVLGTAALTASVAWYRFNSAQTESQRILMGVGRASGATVGQINDIATAAAATGEVSTREARAMANALAATGQIGVGMFGGLIESTRGYAKIMGQDLATAQAAVAQAFADPEKGAVTLNRQLLILNATQLENIQTMARQGDRLGATAALQAALAQGVKNATELTTGWGHAFEWAGNRAGSFFDKVGKGVDRFLTGGDIETRIKDLQAVLSTMPEAPGGLLGALGVGAQRGALQKELDELLRRQREAEQRARQGQGNADSTAVQAIMDRYNPARKQLEQLENDASDIESKLGNVELDKRGEARRQMEALRAQAQALRTDLAAGGQALADSLRNAQFENRMVGAVGFGRSAADINQQQDAKLRDATLNRATDPGSFDAKVKAIEDERRVLLDTLTKTTTQSTNAIGGAFSRMSAEVQQQLLAGSQRFPRVPVGVAAAIAQAESSGNLDVGRTGLIDERGRPGTAYGLGQITASTGADLQRRTGIDRMNRATMGEALAGVLDMKIEQANGDLFKALMNYRGSRDPAVNRAYATNILRQAGQLGDPSTQAVGAAQDAATRATRDQQEALRRASELYGVNTEKLNSVSDAQAKYNALIDAGMAPNEELRKTLLGLAAAAERANRDVSLVQFRRDNAFERDQLGRTDPEARAYSAARSRFGDVNDPRARAMIGESMETNRLQEMKYTVGDTIQGFATDLRRATSPLDALANAANRVADKLLGKFIDSFVSSAFGATGPLGAANSNGSGIGDFFKSIWPFANGGIMTPGGPVPLRAYSRGGVAHSPQFALHGEGGMPEAYVPLPDGRSIPVTVQAPANTNAPAPTQPAQVTIINNSGQPVERRTVNGPRGPREEIIIGKAMANAMASGELDEVMRRRFGQKATG